jgi:hypothetical protein
MLHEKKKFFFLLSVQVIISLWEEFKKKIVFLIYFLKRRWETNATLFGEFESSV